ncbi:MAG: ATP-binding cassette domain-containing protein [Candidatus Nanopelagicales bacterium]
MIRFDHVSVTYPNRTEPTLRDVNVSIDEGELVLVVGRTGSGKSTLLRAVNGLVPHFTGGTVSGTVTVAGRDTRTHHPRDLADVVGVVVQDPRHGFVADLVEDEIAYGMESIGLSPEVMRRRVEESLDLLGLTEVRSRPLRTLSGGQQQRTAIAAVLAQHPKALVLDEPTSALDPVAAEEVLAALQRIVHDLGVTVLLAEHRLERVVQFADRVLHVDELGRVELGLPHDVLSHTPVAPPVVELGRLLEWSPLPLSVRDARRLAAPLKARLSQSPSPMRVGSIQSAPTPLVEATDVTVVFGQQTALRGVSLTVKPGEVVAMMGRNGAGKSTLLRSLAGLQPLTAGRISIGGRDPRKLSGPELLEYVAMVPQEPGDLLWSDQVGKECDAADRDSRSATGSTWQLFQRLTPVVDPSCHPRDLSEGQRLALALAVTMVSDAKVLLLDEPTRGLDYPTKARLVKLLREHAAAGGCVLLATHDVELVAEVASRTVVLADGEIVADGATRDVVVGSPQFAPQIAKILAPLPWLTVSDVIASLPEAG